MVDNKNRDEDDKVISYLQDGDDGVCSLIETETGKKVAVCPDFAVARRVAMYAISPDGGYCGIEIQLSPDLKPNMHSILHFIG